MGVSAPGRDNLPQNGAKRRKQNGEKGMIAGGIFELLDPALPEATSVLNDMS